MHFKMLSAIRFNLDQSKILSSGSGLKPMVACFNSLPNDTIRDVTKFKTFADGKL